MKGLVANCGAKIRHVVIVGNMNRLRKQAVDLVTNWIMKLDDFLKVKDRNWENLQDWSDFDLKMEIIICRVERSKRTLAKSQ